MSDVFPRSVPSRTPQIKLYELNEKENAPDPIRDIESDAKAANMSLNALGWERWKTVFVRFVLPFPRATGTILVRQADRPSFQKEDGSFGKPEYTIPPIDDEEGDEA